jgi:hypothetical protein
MTIRRLRRAITRVANERSSADREVVCSRRTALAARDIGVGAGINAPGDA